MTGPSTFKTIDENFDGNMPTHERMKVYIFPSHERYFEEPVDLLKDLQSVVYFELADNEQFGASKAGIYNYENYLVIPNGVEFYIDPQFRKPDNSSVTVQDLHIDSGFGNSLSIGSIGVLYDYEYVQVPAIWFVVDGNLYADKIDTDINEIKSLLKTHVSRCVAFKELHPDREGPCPS